MATTATWTAVLTTSGDASATVPFAAAANQASPFYSILTNLTTGNNTFTAPTGGATVQRVTIVPPAGNTIAITLKGVNGDTGFLLHKTDPTSIAVDAAVTQIVLSAANNITGIRVIWS